MLKKNLSYLFEKISYSNNTTCIDCNNINLVKKSITTILDQEGYSLIPKPPLVKNPDLLIKNLLTRPWLINSLKIVALMKSDSNWITIKTSRPKLFCHTIKRSNRLMLSELAVKSGCQTFHYYVEERRYGVLLEANTIGQTFASGYIDCNDIDKMIFLSQPVRKTSQESNFYLLDVPAEFKDAGKIKVRENELEKQKKEKELEKMFDEQPHQAQFALSEWKKLHMSWFERTDEDLGKLICKSYSFWHENNLLYKAYAEPEQLEKDGVELLFFCSEKLVRKQNIKKIWSPITSRDDYGVEQDLPW